jgi:inner membrane protein
MIAGWLVEGPRAAPPGGDESRRVAALRRWTRAGATFAAIGMVPDVDLLVGLHSMYTHSVAAVAVAAALAWLARPERGARWALACAASLASHVVLDWLGTDTVSPIGVMALWPFSLDFYQSPLQVFPAVSRRFGQWSFVVQNAKAALFEIVVLGPIAALAGRGRPAGGR